MFFDLLYDVTGLQIFTSRLFAAGTALFLAFLISMLLFPPYIKKLQSLHFSAEVKASKHNPVMPAGILFMGIILVLTLFLSRFNPFVIAALAVYTFYAIIGAVDDIAKIVNKRKLLRNEISVKEYQYKTDGISASLRLTLYLLISFIVTVTLYKFTPSLNEGITIPFISTARSVSVQEADTVSLNDSLLVAGSEVVTEDTQVTVDANSVVSTAEISSSEVEESTGGKHEQAPLPVWLFIPLMTIVIAVMANGVNFTDGFDTLTSVPLLSNFAFIAIIAYVSSRPDWSSWFLIPQIQGIQEVLPLIGAAVGVLLAFLWFNAPPSTIIMGDSGSIALGGLVGILFVFIKAEFYLPIVAFIFIVEFASSFIQIFWYKLTKKRVFRMAPIHHHYQLKMRESGLYSRENDIKSKITWRFHILSIILLFAGLFIFLKVR